MKQNSYIELQKPTEQRSEKKAINNFIAFPLPKLPT
jgi:hypothetical protein